MPGLLQVLAAGNVCARKHAAFALGEIGPNAKVLKALHQRASDEDVHVRIAVAEAVGLGKVLAASVDTAVQLLLDEEAEVRFSAALSLARLGACASSTRAQAILATAVEPLAAALDDNNRYVSAYAADALEQIASPQALARLLPFLRQARWCAHTDGGRPF